MDSQLPAILLMGGGEGMGPVKKTALDLGTSLYNEELGRPIRQMIVICGRNKSLVSTLESLEWKILVQVHTSASYYIHTTTICHAQPLLGGRETS